jgi:hypothetical protein
VRQFLGKKEKRIFSISSSYISTTYVQFSLKLRSGKEVGKNKEVATIGVGSATIAETFFPAGKEV